MMCEICADVKKKSKNGAELKKNIKLGLACKLWFYFKFIQAVVPF